MQSQRMGINLNLFAPPPTHSSKFLPSTVHGTYKEHISSALCFLSGDKTPWGAGNTLYRTSTSPQGTLLFCRTW